MVLGALLQWPGDSLIAESREIPARRVLAQHPVPVIAVADGGAVLFANTSFAKVLGCSRDAVTSISYRDICSVLPTDETLFAVARLCPDTIGSLLRLGRATLFVKMRRSAVVSGADSVAVPLFEGLIERLSRLAEPRGAPLEVRSTTVPDNPHEQRGHAKSVALGGPVEAVAELPRALSNSARSAPAATLDYLGVAPRYLPASH